ncbi:redox-regulated ATPase YchF [Coxiella-like endosymbiont of Amblyomma americanum]|uniref:redox-regulated ATPase YchF n=1 Tax=Coxiella-like endosymbiont of Amblyomma americanum TaxID=1987500 RepID=UPI000F89E3E2|nr:redox-regulated ATPase YchF [Coxiella-like endosymbiont of Amblyomma americanum]AUJ58561.1 redox-regulated ATPase YchF [Coxiella-like endosymbiont of Amblyomma americanum]
MGLKCGIIGLPNVGKSTLFNALTKLNVAVSYYPFCTIEPKVGVVFVPDIRLKKISQIANSKRIIPSTVSFVDIAGLVSGASKGIGLGNQFLANIRETQAIIHVVRCFADENVVHVSGTVKPLADIDVINTELALADMEMIDKILTKLIKYGKHGDKKAQDTKLLFEKFKNWLNEGKQLRNLKLTKEEEFLLRYYQLLTIKPVLYIANLSKENFKNNPFLKQILEYTIQENTKVIPICASLEAEIVHFTFLKQRRFLKIFNLREIGLNRVIQASYALLGLITFFTAEVKETRAWACPRNYTASQAAGMIHTDFKRRFICAVVISYDHYIQYRGIAGAKHAGKCRIEGKNYIVQDGDIIYFRIGRH